MKACDQLIDMKVVRIDLTDGKVREGIPINIDYADDTGRGEDAICIQTASGELVSILESEILRFEEVPT